MQYFKIFLILTLLTLTSCVINQESVSTTRAPVQAPVIDSSPQVSNQDGRATGGTRDRYGNGNRVALVIGNANYEPPKAKDKYPQDCEFLTVLQNPLNDADDMAAILRKYGFTVILHKDIDQLNMEGAIREFGRVSENADTALFFYAGHAVQGDNRNYLLPTDAVLCGQVDFDRQGVGLNYLMDVLDRAKSKANLVMLDACRTNPFGDFRGSRKRGFFSRGDSSPGGLAAMATTLRGSVVVYAAAPGEGASDNHTGRNGLFTEGLMQAFSTNKDLSLDGVLTTASRWVESKSQGSQIPYVNGPETLKKDFFFAGSREQLAAQQQNDKQYLKGNGYGIFQWFATTRGGTALDGEGNNSPTAKALAEIVTNPSIGLYELAKSVRLKVLKETNNHQNPTWDDLIIGEDVSLAANNGFIKIALVIGNNEYKDEGIPLFANPINDVKLIGRQLNTIGFDVNYLLDGDRLQINERIDIIANNIKKLSKKFIFVLYYAGLGVEIDDIYYLIPVDAEKGNRNGVEDRFISLESVKNKFRPFMEKGYLVFFLDSCRVDPFR